MYKLPDRLIVGAPKFRILFMHLHQFDRYNKDGNSLIGRIATEFWGGVERVAGIRRSSKWLNQLEDFAHGVLMKFKKSAQDLSDDDYIRDSVEEAKKAKCNIIVGNHTHKPKAMVYKNVTYVNSGTWINGRTDYVYIDTAKKQIQIKKF
jgi:UDP-2,3-diacylglucosamine pyrophosphatase LpxH